MNDENEGMIDWSETPEVKDMMGEDTNQIPEPQQESEAEGPIEQVEPEVIPPMASISEQQSIPTPMAPVQPRMENGNQNTYQNPYQNTYQNQQPVVKQDNSLAIVSLVLGIIACTIGCCLSFINLAVAIGAIICGVLALNKDGRGMAIAGIVLGSIGVAGEIGMIILMIIGVMA